jgi:dihydroorotate dehydrogenase electron transfer subunit
LRRSILCYGANGKDELLAGLVEGDFTDLHFSTMDGSYGFRGDVVSLCAELVEAGSVPASACYSCGPSAMVRSLVGRLGKRLGVHETSLETIMACGVGACRGCTVPVRGPDGPALRAVCSDGTVFPAEHVAWDQWKEDDARG